MLIRYSCLTLFAAVLIAAALIKWTIEGLPDFGTVLNYFLFCAMVLYFAAQLLDWITTRKNKRRGFPVVFDSTDKRM